MSGPFGSSQWMYNSGGDFYGTEIDGSLQFAESTTYLNRTPSSSGNRQTWTVSFWVKFVAIGTEDYLFSTASGSNETWLRINGNGTLQFQTQGGSNTNKTTSAAYRDSSSWYHIVIKFDSTQATADNRQTLYVNGVQQTWSGSNASLNESTTWNHTNGHKIGERNSTGSGEFSGYIADFYNIDGQALNPTSFGETKSGIWIPKAYSGSYGTNGFHLEFAGNTNDSSGNGNNWTANGLGSWDYVTDSPTNNFNVGMKTDTSGPGTVIEGGRRSYVTSQGNYYSVGTSMGVKGGKWYYECRPIRGGNNSSGLPDQRLLEDGRYCNSNSAPTGRISMNIGTQDGSDGVYMVAMDLDNGYIYRGRNGSWSNGASASGISSGSGTGAVATLTSTQRDQYLRLVVTHRHDTGTSNLLWNFGQDSTLENYTSPGGNSDENGYGDFKYAPPTNFLAMCSKNLPDPAVDPAAGQQPSDYFNTVLWTGTGSGQSITGMGFQPDWLWFKSRNNSNDHALIDSVRGVNQGLVSNSSAVEVTSGASNDLVSFDSDGFTTGTPQNFSSLGSSGFTIATWGWKAGGTAVSNTDGSITSTVSANQDAGFSIATYTGNATAGATVGHGLGVAPDMVIVKARARSGGSDWPVYHRGIPNSETGWIRLNLTNGWSSTSILWNNTAPSSSVVTLGSYDYVNDSGTSHVMYSFAEIEGYSKFGSYTGGGDGTYIYTGFRPAFVMIKNYNTSSHHWVMYDNERNGYNTIGPYLYANTTSTEMSATRVDFMSNGFLGRVSNYDIAQSGVGFIYMAFAEQPFKYANAR